MCVGGRSSEGSLSGREEQLVYREQWTSNPGGPARSKNRRNPGRVAFRGKHIQEYFFWQIPVKDSRERAFWIHFQVLKPTESKIKGQKVKKKLPPSINKARVTKQNYEEWLPNEENFDLKYMRTQSQHIPVQTLGKRSVYLKLSVMFLRSTCSDPLRVDGQGTRSDKGWVRDGQCSVISVLSFYCKRNSDF